MFHIKCFMLTELFNLFNYGYKNCDFKRYFLLLYYFLFFEIIIKQFSPPLSFLKISPYSPPSTVHIPSTSSLTAVACRCILKYINASCSVYNVAYLHVFSGLIIWYWTAHWCDSFWGCLFPLFIALLSGSWFLV